MQRRIDKVYLGAVMRKRYIKPITLLMIVVFAISVGIGQESTYLTQKLMVENDLRKRIKDALSKILDPSQFVVDINVTLELSDAIEEQVTYGPTGGSTSSKAKKKLESQMDALLKDTESRRGQVGSETMVGLPIPGFEFEVEPQGSDVETIDSDFEEKLTAGGDKSSTADENVLSRTASVKRPSMARVQKMEISVILQEGFAPELIENVRQIVMVASRYNRARGDVLSIMTASFKERRDDKTAEQILLRNIAEKLEVLEKTRREKDDSQTDDWKTELDDYKEQEAKRREDDREFFSSQLGTLEAAAKERSFREEKREILRQDSIRLQALNSEIQQLKDMLVSNTVSDSEATETESVVQQKEQERASLDTRIEGKITELEAVQADLDRLQQDTGLPLFVTVLLSILGSLLLILLIALMIMAFRGQRQPAYPPPYGYPPRRPKKKRRPQPVTQAEPVQAPVQPIQSAQQSASPSVDEDPAVLQSEIGDIRKSIVSMSVGQPETTTRIVKEWLQEEAPPEPVAPEEKPEEAEEETDNKKKRKKK